MRAMLLGLVACLLASCVSSTRAREAHCLGAMMLDAWQAEDAVKSAERTWRSAQQARFERSLARQESSVPSVLVINVSPPPPPVASVPHQDHSPGDRLPDIDEERALYSQVVAAHARHRETAEWYRRVAHRVRTRIEEDEMLYPVLGTLATSTAIVFYPLVRWNVRSVLWDGVDPDAQDDPVQKFCAARLEPEGLGLHP